MLRISRRGLICSASALACGLAVSPALAQKKFDDGASDTEIKIGHTNPYSGNTSAYGLIGRTHEAFLMQNDDYGKDYFNGFKQGLGSDANRIVQLATYEVADPTVDNQVIQLKNSGANVFFNISTPKFAAQAIKKAAEIGWKPAHYLNNVSASIGAVIKPAGLENAQGIVTAYYLKDPNDGRWAQSPDMVEWGKFMDKYMPQADKKNSLHVTAYAAANTLVEVLKRCGDDLTRANVMKQAASLKNLEGPMLLPGIKINTSATDFYPIQAVQLQRFEGETWKLFGDVISNDSQNQ